MPSAFAANAVAVTVDGSPLPQPFIVGYSNRIGSAPAECQVLIGNGTVEAAAQANSNYKGKEATVTVDGTTLITGHVYRVQKRQSDRSVVLTIMDKRWLINKTYVGAAHLDTLDGNGIPTAFNGVKGLGADITFNYGGKPNKDTGSLTFVQIGGDNTTGDADYWTYGQAIDWVWTNYITDVTKPTIPTTGGLDQKADQVSLFGVPVAEALDLLFARTRSQWYLDGDGAAHIFDIDNPVTTLALTFPDPDTPTSPADYTLATPEEFIVEESIDDAAAQVDIVGGKQLREAAVLQTMWNEAIDYTLDTAPGWVTIPTGNTWSNYNIQFTSNAYGGVAQIKKKYILKPDVYETLKIGPNLRANDQPYKMLSELLIARDNSGNFVAVDSDNASYGVGIQELLVQQYPDGFSVNLDRCEIIAVGTSATTSIGQLINPPLSSLNPPAELAIVFECAGRSYVSSATAVTGAPATLRRAVVRDEFIHKTRAATVCPMPVLAFYNSGANQWIITEPIAAPPSSTALYNTVVTPALDPISLRRRLTAGVVVDGIAPLNELKTLVADNVGVSQVNGRGAFPSFRVLMPGTRLTATPNNYGLGGKEIVTAVSFSDETQQVEFAFTNRLGNDITELAQSFVDTREFRRPL